ncbi:15736_t:CDS:2, partial [Acaulospora colombiana]
LQRRFMSVFSTKRLENKTVLVTGASAGIGEATAILFAKAGANVIIAARRQEALSNVLQSLKEAHSQAGIQCGGKFAAVKLDVSNRQEVSNLWAQVPQDLREVDILGMPESVYNNGTLLKETSE